MKKFSIILAIVLIGLLAARAGAVDTYWQVGTAGWSDPGSWNNDEPGFDDHAYINNGGTAQITQAGEQCGRLDLGEGAGQSGSVILSGDGQLSADGVFVGYNGTGTFTQTGGTHTVSSDLSIGDESPSASGTYELSGTGQLWANYEHVGYDGTGTFTQTGGTNTVGMALDLGVYAGSNGTYELSGDGELSAYQEWIGYGGTGSFIQSGGTNTISDRLYLGKNSGSNGTYELSGTGHLSADEELIGDRGTASFIQTGGTNTIDRYLYLGMGSGSDGTYELSGTGQLSANYSEFIGQQGTGSFIQTGGTNTVSKILCVGRNPGSDGTYTLSREGQLSANQEWIGLSGTGTFTQTGGTNSVASDLDLAIFAGSNGTYKLSGGTLDITGNITSGDGSSKFIFDGGTLTVDGGSIDVTVFVLADDVSSNVTHGLSGSGQLSADYEFIGFNGTGSFVQTGGTNTAGLGVGLGMMSGSNGTYELSGTAQLLAGGLTVGSMGNGTLTIDSGATATCSDATVVGSVSGSNGTALVTGSGSSWTITDNLLVAVSGSGTLTVSDGASLHADVTFIGANSDGTGVMNINDNSVFTTGDLYTGLLGSGTFNINNSAADITISNLLYFGLGTVFTAVPGSTIHMTGSAFENYNSDPTDLAGLSNLELIYDGHTGEVDPFELAGEDMGRSLDGYIDNFALGALTLEADCILQLVDDFDNAHRGGLGGSAEALYLDELTLLADSTLNLNGLHLYYRFLDDQGGSIINGQLISMIPGDVDGDGWVSDTDLSTIMSYWGQSLGREFGDLNGNDIVDGPDYSEVLSYWNPPLEPPAEPIPEPATLGLLLTGGLVLFKRLLRPFSHSLLRRRLNGYVFLNSSKANLNSSTVSKVLTQSKFSFSVRMNLSA